MSKVNWTEITGSELKAILKFLRDQRDLFSTLKSDQLPETGPCHHCHSIHVDGGRLEIELKIERKFNYNE